MFLALGAGAALLIVAALSGNLDYYSDVEALLEASSLDHHAAVRVRGTVKPGSISHDLSAGLTRFRLAGEQRSVEVVFSGDPPPLFAPGREVVVTGRLQADGVFEASEVFTKCPSKYEARRESEP